MATATCCICPTPGYCPRYGREMAGRFYEICQGIDIDLGTAAAFRTLWQQEAPEQTKSNGSNRIPLLLQTDQAPGDAVVITAAIYSLHKAHPGRYATSIESYWPDVFEHNPDVVDNIMATGGAILQQGCGVVRMHYPAIHQSNDRGIHFMEGMCEFLGSALGISVPLATDRPCLYFDDSQPPIEDYWLVCSGGKRDMTNKLWGWRNYQEVVTRLRGSVKFIQVGGSRPPVPWREDCAGSQEDDHPPLRDTIDNLVGKTTLRDLFNLVRQARGILCGVSLPMHVAAALDRPAIVIAGGREPVAWNAYPKQQYVHTIGALPCRDILGHIGRACWRSRVVPLGDNTSLDRDTCERPINVGSSQVLPACMTMISPELVAELVLRYNGQT